MKSVSVIFPHQLFLENPPAGTGQRVYLVEEDLFFRQYSFHKSKLVFHRASMKYYQDYLEKRLNGVAASCAIGVRMTRERVFSMKKRRDWATGA